MKKIGLFGTINILGLVAFDVAFSFFNVITGVAITSIVLGIFLTILLEEVLRDWKTDEELDTDKQ